MTRLTRFIQNIINSFLEFYKGIQWGGKFIGTAIRDWMIDGFTRLITGVLENLETGFSDLLRKTIESAEETGEIPEELKGITDELKNPTKAALAFLGMTAGGAAGGGLISSTIGPFLLKVQYAMQRKALQYRLPLGTIVEGERREIATPVNLRDQYLDQGLTDDQYNLLVEVSKLLVDVQHLVTLRARKVIEGPEYIARMAKLGYDETEAEDYYKALEFYPTPQDLVRWQAREVFEPTMVKKYGLGSEYEQIDKEPFYRAHMTDEQILNFWYAHWEHASWTQVQDMLFRGLITEADVWDWFRLVEIPPFWRQKLIDTAYRVFTRVDVRRMHKIGVLDLEGVKRAYLDLGYNEFRAGKMAEFTEKYNRGTTVEGDRDLTKTDILRLYGDRIITEADARDMLADLDYQYDEITYLLDLYTKETALRTRDLTLSQVKNLYQLGLRTKGQCTPFLEKFGFDSTEIIALYDLWDWEKPARVARPTRAQLDKFLASEIIPWDTWVVEYRGLGYDDLYIGWYFDLLLATGKVEE